GASAVLAAAATGAADAADSGLLESLVKGMASGTLTGAVALAPGIHGASGPDGLVIDGSSGPVLGAGLADLLILPAGEAGDESWGAGDAAGLEVTPLGSMGGTRPGAPVD